MGGRQGLSERVREDLIPGLRGHPASIVWLAYDGGRPVGIAVCFAGFSTFTARPVVNIHDLAVTPDAQRQGVGSRLLEAVQSKARQLNCSKITLEVYEDNLPARQLYRSAGFGSGDDGHGKAGVPSLFLVKRLT
jgi:GNAT superfamily N-acetyltransferase